MVVIFELISQPGKAITSFNQAQINQGFIKFIHDGGENPPSYELRISDSLGGEMTATSQTGEFTKVNDAPKIG
ncbi:MAG: hypothetical protein HC908_06435 [Calothrix sp. SM1_7_51]|nr:hypothetical protein [Calothrix sp. SM1_7_51]